MFNNNLTQTYNFEDATQEIVVMILGAFLLGCILAWLLSKLLRKDYQNDDYEYAMNHQHEGNYGYSNTLDHSEDIDLTVEKTLKQTVEDPDTEYTSKQKVPEPLINDLENSDIEVTKASHKVQSNNESISLNEKVEAIDIDKDSYQKHSTQPNKNTTKLDINTIDEEIVDLDDSIDANEIVATIDKNRNANIYEAPEKLADDKLSVNEVTEATITDTTYDNLQTEIDKSSHTNIVTPHLNRASEPSLERTKLVTESEDINVQNSLTNGHLTHNSSTKPHYEDLTVIGGIDNKIQAALNKQGIFSYIDLRDIRYKKLKSIQNNLGFRGREIDTWANQASIAAKGQWNKLEEYQSFIKKTEKASKQQKILNTDDLTVIEGITPEISNALDKNDIRSFRQIRKIESALLQEIVLKTDPNLHIVDTESWSHQAAMAEKEQWEELKIYQGFMESETFDSHFIDTDDIEQYALETETPISSEDTRNIFESIENDFQKGLTDSEDNKVDVISKQDTLKHANTDSNLWESNDNFVSASSSQDSKSTTKLGNQVFLKKNTIKTDEIKAKNDHRTLIPDTDDHLDDHDDLKKIEGIGPKIEDVLNQSGIYTFSQLSNSNSKRLNQVLSDAGSRFKMHDPETWPEQARLASKGDWEALTEFNKSITNTTKSATKEEPYNNHLTTKANVISIKDDLTKIEGIGPKIQELLKTHDIQTFQSLSECSRMKLKTILNDAGPQFRMHEPESWPYQARLAAIKDWDELIKYQDFLLRGRE